MSDIQGNPPPAHIVPSELQRLPRVLGLFDGTTIVIGSIIGSGIFLSVKGPAQAFGNYWIIISFWIGAGIVTLLGSLVLAELAAMMPHAGGPYIYLKEAFGPKAAFLWGWTEFTVVRTGSLGALSCGTVIYLNELTPMSIGMQEAVAIMITVGLSVINMIQTRWGAGVQNLTTVVKTLFLGMVILVPWLVGQNGGENLQSTAPGTVNTSFFAAFGATLVAILWAYDGWVNIAPVAEEIKNPERNVPLALGIGLGLIVILYMLAITSYHMALSMTEVASSSAVAATLSSQLLGGDWGGKIASLGVVISTFGAVNSNLLAGPRIYFAMARDGLLPPAIRKVHPRFKTPANAILLQCVWTVILIVIVYGYNERSKYVVDAGTVAPVAGSDPSSAVKESPAIHNEAPALDKDGKPVQKAEAPMSAEDAFYSLISYVIVGGQLFYALAVASVFVLRKKHPEWPRPYKAWGYPYTPALYLLSFAIFIILGAVDNWRSVVAGLGLIAIGAVVYSFTKNMHHWRTNEPIPEDLP